MKRIDQIMQRHIRAYRRQGKSEAWIKGWKRGWYEVGRRLRESK